jgi:hypothetical protein
MGGTQRARELRNIGLVVESQAATLEIRGVIESTVQLRYRAL